jgi:hypothetical protein
VGTGFPAQSEHHDFDPYFGHHLTQIHMGWMETLYADDRTFRELISVIAVDKYTVVFK